MEIFLIELKNFLNYTKIKRCHTGDTIKFEIFYKFYEVVHRNTR